GQAATGYFGNVTKAAVAKFQAAVGLTPPAGYFGAKTRAYVASNGAGSTGGTTTGGTTTGGNVTAPATGLAVSYASDNPSGAASLISGAARVPVLALNYTAGNSGAVTLTGVKFTKTGVISDSSISGAYLVANGQVLGQYNSLSSGVITFSNLSISIPAGQTKELWLAVDISTAASAGNSVSFKVASVSDITAVDTNNTAITPSGNFPVSGVTFTASTVTSPALATLTITSSTVGSTAFAGTQGVLVSQWTNSVSNSPVKLTSINFRVIGSANKSDLRNVKLYVNGTQVGSTLTSVSSDGYAYFDLTSAPATLGTGSSNIQLYADIAGSPSYTFQFELLNSYDVYAIDSQYNIPVSVTVTGGTGGLVTIQPGQLTVSLSTDSPTGNVAKGQSGVTVAKFSIYAAGEAVKVKYLDFGITVATSAANSGGYLVASAVAPQKNLSTQIKNVALVDDAGNQVGSTINTPGSTITACSAGSVAVSTVGVYTDCFGTVASPINYIIPANTTRVLSLRVDIQTTADFSSIKGSLTGNTANLQGLTSASTNDTGAVSGSTLTLAANSLTVAANSAIGSQTVTTNAASAKIGSYTFTASTAEGVTISNVTIVAGATAASNFNNLLVKVGSTQFGSTYPTVTSGGSYTFSGTPFTVAAGQTVVLDVYAGVLSGAATNEQASTLSSCTGTGLTSFSAISCSSSVNGQTVLIGGVPTLTVAIDSGATAPVGQLVMGTTQNPLATLRFTETTGNEDVKITDLTVFQTVPTTTAATAINPALQAYSNLVLYNGSTVVGTAGTAVVSAATSLTSSTGYLGGFTYRFNFATPVVVPKSTAVSLTLKGDVNGYNSNIPVDNTTSTFRIATSTDANNNSTSTTVVALGNSSNRVATVSLSSPTGNTQTVLRSNLLVSSAVVGATSGRAKNITDDVGSVTFTASTHGGVVLNTVTTTISGTLASSTFLSAGDVKLWDASQSVAVGTAVTSSLCAGTGASCVITFQIGTGLTGYNISAGSSKTFVIRVNSLTNTKAPVSGVSLSLAVSINANTDVAFTDAIDGTGVTAYLPANAAPVNISSVSYAAGS
ncbi:MAG: peptidoglycan-binding domain-containing protein, partial [Candidatus Wolfebacteria bacterium]|nr:peptidoglycan-binding domain-containing protein [Candidatus Wolfebacteria bacterium]